MKVRTFQSFRQFSCNVYVISSEHGNILIDPGHYDQRIRHCLKEIGGVDAVLLTHGHWDHTYGLDALHEDYPDAPVYIHEKDRSFLRNPTLNGSAFNGFALVVKADVSAVQEGRLRIGGYDVDIIHMPGHTAGSVICYFPRENVLFTGDTVMKNTSSPTFSQTGSAEALRQSMRKFVQYGFPEDTEVYPGHGESTTCGYLFKHNPDVKGAAI